MERKKISDSNTNRHKLVDNNWHFGRPPTNIKFLTLQNKQYLYSRLRLVHLWLKMKKQGGKKIWKSYAMGKKKLD